MKGSVVRFISTTTFIVFGILIIWWFKSVVTSEVFIVSDRHRETFSTVNYAELGRKTFEEAVVVYSQTGVSKAGSAGGVMAESSKRKDGVAIWKISPSADTIKSALNEYAARELAGSMVDTLLPGKHLAIKYENPAMSVEADNADFSKSEKILVKASGDVKASKSLETQAMSMAAGMKVNIDTSVKVKYFALYDAAKRFLGASGPTDNINSAFGTINAVGTKTNDAPKCTSGVAACNPADLFSSACPSSSASVPTDAEVLAETGYSDLTVSPFSIPIAGEPFASFRAKFEKYEAITTKAGYGPGDKAVTPGSCSFTCNYQWINPCKTTVTDPCVPAEDPNADPVCPEPRCVPGIDINTQSCSATTQTSRISFTFLADMYAKYSSEDPNGFVPSRSLKNIAGKMLPYETLKFNFLTHSCSMISGGVATELKDSVDPCSFPSALAQV